MQGRRIWLVDETGLFEQRLGVLLRDSSFEVALRSASMASLGRHALRLGKPVLIIVVLREALSAGSSAAELERLCAEFADSHVVVVADALSVLELEAAIDAGASGFLPQDISPDALRQSLLLAALGEKIFPADLITALMDGPELSRPAHASNEAELTSRERLILGHLANGYSNKAIAERLDITEGTVKVHIKVVFKKIGARNRTEAAIWALHHGLDASD
jgi:two-component system nitrate/nitrite response regulator NarL